ncbi:FMR1-interacting protein NUFIP1 [Musca domestica]|uniref:Nuclear fragile X mental retardation-interacting protein 1 n=1 Tax=Musca domestica TaxID=7370 RepID=A0A1I8M1A5_MUSDO|nr:FMR1-interacting protein NUFIP1 [Musca domestica]
MEPPPKFLLPSPNFNAKGKNCPTKPKPHFLTPSGMTLLPREKQPPPMYGKRGATVPARFLKNTIENVSKPEPMRQYCEPCEIELASLEDLKHHRAQHEKCPVDGCQYRGHAMVMDKHVTALHSSGLFDKFKKLNTPEEIAAWRAERRKRYPTVENVLLKQKAQEQRQKRGERLEASKCRFGKQDDRKRALPTKNTNKSKGNDDNNKPPNETNGNPKPTQRNNKRNKKKRRNQRDKKDDKDKSENVIKNQLQANSSDEEDEFKTVVRFQGTRGMKDYKHLEAKVKETNKNALLSLVGMYGSDDDDDEDQDEAEATEMENNDIKMEGNEVDHVTHSVPESQSLANNQNSCESSTEDVANLGHRSDQDVGDIDADATGETVAIKINDLESQPQKNRLNPPECSVELNGQHENFSTNIDTTATNEDEKDSSSQSSTTVPEPITIPINEDDKQATNPQANSSDEGPEEVPIQHHMTEYKIQNVEEKNATNLSQQPKCPPKATEETKRPTKPAVKRKSGLDYRKAKLRKQNTMLEKLLETDIRHERNVLLQCVRFVCENNFFGIGRPSTNN